jgi:valyl-tRNA synthetase
VETLPGVEVILPLPAVDVSKEKVGLEKKCADLRAYVEREEAKLSNPSFYERAPKAVVDDTRKRVEAKKGELEAVLSQLERLSI